MSSKQEWRLYPDSSPSDDDRESSRGRRRERWEEHEDYFMESASSSSHRKHSRGRSRRSSRRRSRSSRGGGGHKRRESTSSSRSSSSGDEEHKRRKRDRDRKRRSRSPSSSSFSRHRRRDRSRTRSRSNRRRHNNHRRDVHEDREGRPPVLPPPHVEHRERDRDRHHHRRSCSEDSRPRHHHRRSHRRKKSRRHGHDRSRSFSPSPSSSESSSSASSRMPPPRMPAVSSRAGVVSDDEQGIGMLSHPYGNPYAHAQQQQQDRSSQTSSRKSNRRKNKNNAKKRKRESSGAKSSSQARDDTVGHFLGGPGTIINDYYRIIRELGVGTFGRVVECLDLEKEEEDRRRGYVDDDGNKKNGDDNLVAIKMVRKVRRYYESAIIEADILSEVNRKGGPRSRGTTHFAILHDAFSFRGHYCLVFESLGPSLYDYIKRNEYAPFPMRYILEFARQIIEAVEFIHSFRLIHTDLKPENVLVTKCRDIVYKHRLGYITIPERTKIKVIDFGGATYDDDKKSSVINTRQYRAPEVILGTGWSMPSDLWSVGCILAELYLGELLFQTHNDIEHLALMEITVGRFPEQWLRRAQEQQPKSSLANRVFDSRGRHRMGQVMPLDDASFIEDYPNLEGLVRYEQDAWFLKLLRRLLVIDPEERATARDAHRSTAWNRRLYN